MEVGSVQPQALPLQNLRIEGRYSKEVNGENSLKFSFSRRAHTKKIWKVEFPLKTNSSTTEIGIIEHNHFSHIIDNKYFPKSSMTSNFERKNDPDVINYDPQTAE